MDKLPIGWKKFKYDDLKVNNDIGLVRNTNEQGEDKTYKYLKMNNISIDGKLNFDKLTYVDATKNDLERFSLKKNDFLFNTRNSKELVGKTCLFELDEENVIFNNNILRTRFNQNTNPQFINYQFKSEFIQKQLESIKSGTTNVCAIYYKNLKDITIVLPPLPEQTRIVNKLDSLFVRIDKSIALLEENIKHTEALIDSSTNGVFDSLSEKYQSVPLLKYVDFIGGSQPPKSKFSNTLKDGYVRLIQIRDYKSDNFIVYIDKKSTTKFCNEDDVMIGRYGPPVFQILRGIKGAYNVALMKAVPNEEKISKDYLFYFLQNSKIQNYIISISQRSAGQSGVNKKALEMYEIVVPPLDIQQKTVDVIKELQCKLHRLLPEQQYKLSYLKALKASLLDKAFKGEL